MLENGKSRVTLRMNDEQDTESLALVLASLCEKGTVIALDGDLGAGKTRLSQAIARGLGVQGIVNSPTFTIIKEYEGDRLPLYHMDVYRINLHEAAELGLEEYWEGDGVSIVEWASIIAELLPVERLHIRIETAGNTSRIVHIDGFGPTYEAWLPQLAGWRRSV